MERVALQQQLSEIQTLVLQIGELSSMIPHYVEECFPAAADGTLLENTRLEIEILPGNALCGHCRKVYKRGCWMFRLQTAARKDNVPVPKNPHTQKMRLKGAFGDGFDISNGGRGFRPGLGLHCT